jgi:molybdopterin-guanine dinucleotide biosynthesis protein
VVGKTGTGKSTLIKSVISQAIARGIGVGVLDPHGQLIEEILDESIPEERIHDTIVFAPADRDWPVSLNPIAAKLSRYPFDLAGYAGPPVAQGQKLAVEA